MESGTAVFSAEIGNHPTFEEVAPCCGHSGEETAPVPVRDLEISMPAT